MAKVFIEESTLSAIGNAIREKEGSTELVPVPEMSTRILAIESGGGGELPEEAFVITGDCNYRLSNNGWNWFLDLYSNRISTTAITSLINTFAGSFRLEQIPFTVNVVNCENFSRAFQDCLGLEKSPKVRGTLSAKAAFEDFITRCQRLRNVDDLLTQDMLVDMQNYKVTTAYTCPRPVKFSSCYSLRTIPSWWYMFKLNPESTVYPSASYGIYNNTFYDCYTLDEALDIPVWSCKGAQTSNMFSSFASGCHRLKKLTFETDNGQPIVTQWKSQTLDLSSKVGYVDTSTINKALQYNSGITADKEVKDDATYQALKNDPDWTTRKIEYSRYNHDSAVETINSLPDTSAYLASASGTNTIKFKKTSGSKTDGGAIENLTAEEIAVAAAKGWTVTLA